MKSSSWTETSLESLCEISGGTTPSRKNEKYWNGDICWVTPTDLKRHRDGVNKVNSSNQKISQIALNECNLKLIPPNSVIFSSRATIGKIGITQTSITTNQGFINFIPSKKILPEFLAFFLFHRQEEIAQLSASTTFAEVSRNSLRKYKILLPPLAEQQHIVSTLEEIDELRQKQRKALDLTRQMIPALFYEMFPPDQFRTSILEDLVKIHYGKALKNNNRKTGTCPVFGSNGCIGFHDEALVKSATIIIGRKGSVGKVTFAENGGWPIDTTYYVEPVEKMDLFYLYWALKLSNLELLAISTSLPGLNRNTLYDTPIIVPPIELQNMFTQKAQEALSLLEQQGLSLQKFDALFESTLNQFFFTTLDALLVQ